MILNSPHFKATYELQRAHSAVRTKTRVVGVYGLNTDGRLVAYPAQMPRWYKGWPYARRSHIAERTH